MSFRCLNTSRCGGVGQIPCDPIARETNVSFRAAWWDTSALMKRALLQEHIRYAAAHGVSGDINRYLRALPEEDWARVLDS